MIAGQFSSRPTWGIMTLHGRICTKLSSTCHFTAYLPVNPPVFIPICFRVISLYEFLCQDDHRTLGGIYESGSPETRGAKRTWQIRLELTMKGIEFENQFPEIGPLHGL
jgi:hypothetical protein